VNNKKVMLITGDSRGIGSFLVHYYIEKGYIVIGCSRSNVNILHNNYRHFILDISDEKAVIDMVFKIYRYYKRLDILINNAGIASMNPIILTPGETVKNIFYVNFFGTFVISREASKIMIKQRWGRIINLTTVAVPLCLEGEASYASSKSAIETFTKILAKELAPYEITCNAIGPSPIQTDLIKNIPKEKINNLINKLTIKRLCKFEDIVNVIDFFIKEESSYITGQVIYLGGV